jgi:hypothetical protein
MRLSREFLLFASMMLDDPEMLRAMELAEVKLLLEVSAAPLAPVPKGESFLMGKILTRGADDPPSCGAPSRRKGTA